jgi:hypothetical protein
MRCQGLNHVLFVPGQAVPKQTLQKISIMSGEREVKRGLKALVGKNDPLARNGTAAFLFTDVQAQQEPRVKWSVS